MLLESDSWRPGDANQATRSLGGLGFLSRDMLASICRDFRRILVVSAATFGLAAALGLAMRPQYVADATLLVLLSPEYAVRQVAGLGDTGGGTLDRDAFLKSEIEILQSRPLLQAALDRIGARTLYPDLFRPPSLPKRAELWLLGGGTPNGEARALDRFATHFSASADKTGNIIDVGFRGGDPALAARAVNTVIGLYLAKRNELYRDTQSSALVAEAEAVRQRLEGAEQALAAFKANSGIVSYDTQRELLLRQRDDLTRDVQHEESSIAQAEQSRAAAAAQLAATPRDVVISDEQNTAHAAELARVGATHIGSTVRTGRSSVYESLNLDRARAAIGLEAARARHDADMQQLDEVQAALAKLEASKLEFDRLERARSLAAQDFQAVSKALADRRLVETVENGQDSNVRVIQPAVAPDKPTNLRLVVLAAGVLLSVVAGVMTAVLGNMFRRGYISPETLERRLGVPVLASVPDLTNLDRSYDRLTDYGTAEG